ncbi:hypothetical protein MTR_2g038180 [Medicago truncatula]|uniref:Uncharacterized protein n=1 Tax=Medicago truncatula TaxID=3880 RepID=G7IGA5_MEDTR|nr:hypothetical protein MTR_2g038180 [Medicago truncatula]
MGTKWDIEKFIGDSDFGLWKVKIEVVLIQQKCAKARKGKILFSDTMSQEDKTKMADNARSFFVLCLRDKVLREVVKDTTIKVM